MLRLGVLTPSSNTVLEPITAVLAAPLADRLSVHFTRIRVLRIADDAESHGQFGLEPMLDAVRLLADARVDAYLWSGTSASWEGIDTDRQLVRAIEQATGRPATTSTLALLDAFDLLHVRQYGLVVPYVASITEAIQGNLAAEGYACSAAALEGMTTNHEFASLSDDDVARQVRRVAASGPDAIAIHCTNVRGGEVSVALEDELGIPVLDSVVVGLWGALRLLSLPVPVAGFGTLARLGSDGGPSVA